MRPLTDSGKLGCVLAQFPYAFINKPEARDYLERTMDRHADLNLVIEFRNKSWMAPQTFEVLRQRGVGFCAVDEPQLPRLMPWVSEATSQTAYVRFHGRNAEKWFGTSTAERYDYLYGAAELKELAERVRDFRERVKTLWIFFNNCHAGSAAKNASRFRELLVQDRLMAPPKPQTAMQGDLFGESAA